MIQRDSKHSIAEALAADLAGAQVDPNEAQKALAYLRSQGNGKALFDYLHAIVNNGRVVIRSGRTLGYYRELLAACERHLGPLKDDYEQMLLTFGWSLRLLRYYRAVPEAAKEHKTQQRQQSHPAPQAAQKRSTQERQQSRPEPAQPQQPEPAAQPAPKPKPAPAPARLPQVGETFRGKIEEVDTDRNMVLLELPESFEDAAGTTVRISNELRAETLVVIPPAHAKAGGLKVGNSRWVEVINIRKNGAILEVKPIKSPKSKGQ